MMNVFVANPASADYAFFITSGTKVDNNNDYGDEAFTWLFYARYVLAEYNVANNKFPGFYLILSQILRQFLQFQLALPSLILLLKSS